MSQNCKWTGHIKKDLETLTQRYKEQYLAAVKGDESLLNFHVIQSKALDILVSVICSFNKLKKLGISFKQCSKSSKC